MKRVPHIPELAPEIIQCNFLQNESPENKETLSLRYGREKLWQRSQRDKFKANPACGNADIK